MEKLTLKVDSVQLSFNDRKILQGVYLKCIQGEILGLLGRNGSGKSSLLKVIFGSLTPAFKHIDINGEFIYKGYAGNRIAYLPQHNYLPKGIKIKRLARMLVDGQWWNEFSDLPIYKDHRDKTVSDLSGGELRILETLLVLYNPADFILLDEPFTHISPVQAEFFKPLLKVVAQRKGIIVTDHQYYNVMDVSNRIIILENGYTQPANHIDDLVTYHYLSGIN